VDPPFDGCVGGHGVGEGVVPVLDRGNPATTGRW
jgi:hypothetical protein